MCRRIMLAESLTDNLTTVALKVDNGNMLFHQESGRKPMDMGLCQVDKPCEVPVVAESASSGT